MEGKVSHSFKIVEAAPKSLCYKLVSREVDVAPVPSFFYLTNKKHLNLHRIFSISSKGEVMSVLLISKKYRELKNGARIGITPASTTSINLLKVILREIDKRMEFQSSRFSDGERLLAHNDYALVIGDEAIKSRENFHVVMDLGSAWFELTGLPMVFALLCSMGYDGKDIERLSKSVRCGYIRMDEVVRSAVKKYGIEKDFVTQYFYSLLYTWDEDIERGLRMFEKKCANYGLLESE
jgi:chorismate dehydratase